MCSEHEDRASPYAKQGTDCHELCVYLVEKALGRDVQDPTENLDFYRWMENRFDTGDCVLSWLAGENWRTGVFVNNGDIYCASAMFGVSVEKHGQNAHLRQKGKNAELVLGYGGSVGALRFMGAD